ncbi:CDP-diacylglycerol--glycerol-3-phosphate 3-phosphatidyltransferase [Rhodovulum sp. PH10]|uniref:CDP-alcohol phosphatidyltransferase family protein n=1 Tax=Rhodovulum sp. PH10 TaxID=1187851 RepID=UPI00027C2B39|nr:CDP-alcohol phosphatidyltransferase family protein [Rhodovulum sp. PH10]EJW12101.1 CDP-diacylglycerol--glycerol-3-phosphate 3-phosphatidyltransferase [Rhodovulum sp. PH10]
MNLPNIVTIVRILLVPVLVWTIAAGEMRAAFLLFVAAGISDGIDGFVAKRFGMTTDFGAHLDPLADKMLIIAIFVGLGMVGAIPVWLVILVVSRDILIIGAVMLAMLLGRPVKMRPLMISKLNTVMQIVFASVVLASLGFEFDAKPVQTVIMWMVAALTLLSVGFYTREWMRHMTAAEREPG